MVAQILTSFPFLYFFPVLTSLQFSTLRSRSAFLQTRQRLRSWRPWTTRGRRCSSPRRCPRRPSTPAPSSPTCSSQWWPQGWTTPLPLRGCKADISVFIINPNNLNSIKLIMRFYLYYKAEMVTCSSVEESFSFGMQRFSENLYGTLRFLLNEMQRVVKIILCNKATLTSYTLWLFF